MSAVSFAALSATLILMATLMIGLMPISGAAQTTGTTSPATVAAPAITVISASVQDVRETTIVTGTLVPREEVQVGVDLDGYRVTAVLADDGDSVKAGQALAQLSTDILAVQITQNMASLAHSDAAIGQARSQIAEARASEAEAVAASDRSVALRLKGIVSQGSLDQTTSAARQSTARRQAAEQALAVALADKALVEAQRRELDLRYAKTTVRAPTDGVVLTRSVRIGATVSGSTIPLFTIARSGAIELSAEIPESAMGRISIGQSVIVLAQGKGEPIKGTVRLISSMIDQHTRLGTIKVALPVDDHLRSGAFARGEVEIARQQGVALPISAVVGSGDHRSAKVVIDGHVETRSLTTGISGNGIIAITSGIAAGEAVVLRAATFVRDGESVSPVFASPIGSSK